MSNLAKIAGCSLVIVVASLIVRCETRPPRGSAANHEHLGRVAATELAVLCGDKGGQVSVIGYAGDRRALDQQIDGFVEGLKRDPDMVYLGRADVNPAESADGVPLEGGGFPADSFVAAVRQFPEATHVVSFIGTPDLRDARIMALFQSKAKLVVINGKPNDVADARQRGVLYLAVVNKAVDMSTFTQPAKNPEAWFDRFYEIVRPDKP